MNATRNEAFTVAVSFDGDVSVLQDFTLNLSQGGRVVLSKRMADAGFDDDGCRAYVTFSGRETARLCPDALLYAQVRAVLADGEVLHSEAAEINVVDTLEA